MPDVMMARGRSPRWRRAVRIAGTILTLASIAYVLRKVTTTDWSALPARHGAALLAPTAAASALYAASGFLLSLAWYRLLASMADVRHQRRRIVAGYAVTQIYKYLPSNVMHLLGRHAMSRALGLQHGPLAAAAVMEILGLMLAAGLIALAFGRPLFAAYARRSSALSLPWLPWALVGLVGTVAVVAVALVLRHRPAAAPLARAAASFLQALGLYLGFFVASGAVLYLIAHRGLGLGGPSALEILAIVAIAWALGFVVPGAPAGIGVREAAMILLLTPATGQAPALALAGLYRVATLSGDALVAGAGLLLDRRTGRPR